MNSMTVLYLDMYNGLDWVVRESHLANVHVYVVNGHWRRFLKHAVQYLNLNARCRATLILFKLICNVSLPAFLQSSHSTL